MIIHKNSQKVCDHSEKNICKLSSANCYKKFPLTIKKKKIQHSHRTKANSFVLSLFSLVFWSIIIVNFENQYRGQKGCEQDLFIRRVYGWASWSESEKQGFSTNSWVWWFENCKFQNIGLSFHTASLVFATIFPL